MTGEERAHVRECSDAIARHERFMREPGKLGSDFDLRRTTPAVVTCRPAPADVAEPVRAELERDFH